MNNFHILEMFLFDGLLTILPPSSFLRKKGKQNASLERFVGWNKCISKRVFFLEYFCKEM